MNDTAPSDPIEVELKLHLPPGGRALVEQSPLFLQIPAEPRHEVTTYFDTPDYALLRHGVALRVRRNGNRLIQTVKTHDRSGGAASSRGEWEWEVGTEEPDLARLGDALDQGLVASIEGRLEPVFQSDIRREIRLLHLDEDVTVEAALDEGAIVSGDASTPVSELELELKAGENLGSLYRLALELQETVPLTVAGDSKAARGYHLRTGAPSVPQKAGKLHLPDGVTTPDALRLIVGNALSHLLINVTPAIAGDAEGIHQVRVAIRRLRAALMLFRKLLEPHAAGQFGEELRRIGRLLGEARDWDVFVLETIPAAASDHPRADWLHLLAQAAGKRRETAHGKVVLELTAQAFTRLVLSLSAWVEDGRTQPAVLGKRKLRRKLDELAPGLLDSVGRKVNKRGRHIGRLADGELHELRKALKKLRYDVEFVSSLYGKKAVRSYRKHCEELQEVLGTLNDSRMTIDLAESLAGEGHLDLAPAVGILAQWSQGRRLKALTHLKHAWGEFQDATPFWR